MISQLSVIGIDKALRESGINAPLVGTVHDSITLSAERKDVDEAICIAKNIMETLPIDLLNINFKGKTIYFPMEAEAEVGGSYADEFKYDKDDFYSFKSTKGFTEYYKRVKKVVDSEEAKIIDADKMKAMLAKLEEYKPKFQEMV